MKNFNTLFAKQRHLDAYLKLIDAPLPEALVQLQKDLQHLDFSTFVEPTLVNNYPALKVSATTADNTAHAFVVFDSIYAPYAVGAEGGYGLNAFQTAPNADDASALVANKLKEQILSW